MGSIPIGACFSFCFLSLLFSFCFSFLLCHKANTRGTQREDKGKTIGRHGERQGEDMGECKEKTWRRQGEDKGEGGVDSKKSIFLKIIISFIYICGNQGDKERGRKGKTGRRQGKDKGKTMGRPRGRQGGDTGKTRRRHGEECTPFLPKIQIFHNIRIILIFYFSPFSSLSFHTNNKKQQSTPPQY